MTDPALSADYALTVGSLFSGIGGIDLGLERAGMRVIWHSEVDPYASRVLAKHWPAVPNLGDVTQIDWSTVERPDIVAGGFPCQPVSLAGRRLAQRDERWLWPAFAHCLRSLRPGHVIVENVPGLLVRGMGDVLGDLASLGYDAEWTGIPAAAVGAPHLRWRVLVVAHAVSDGLRHESEPESGRRHPALVGADGPSRPLADANGQGGRQPAAGGHQERLRAGDGRADVAHAPCSGQAVFQGRQANGDGSGLRTVGSPGWWDAEPDVGRVADGIPSRVDRLRCLGNAVVPQVAELVGRRLLAHIDGGESA